MGAPGRALTVVEAGMGFGFLAAIISYLPAILYQAFSSREVSISLLAVVTQIIECRKSSSSNTEREL
jgi:hypothetical protein